MDIALLEKTTNKKSFFPPNWKDYNPFDSSATNTKWDLPLAEAMIQIFKGNTDDIKNYFYLGFANSITAKQRLEVGEWLIEQLAEMTEEINLFYLDYANEKYKQYVTNCVNTWLPKEFTSSIKAGLVNVANPVTWCIYLVSGLLYYERIKMFRNILKNNPGFSDRELIAFLQSDIPVTVTNTIIDYLGICIEKTIKHVRAMKLTDMQIEAISNRLSSVLTTINITRDNLTNVLFDITVYDPSRYHMMVPRVTAMLLTIVDELASIPDIIVGLGDIEITLDDLKRVAADEEANKSEDGDTDSAAYGLSRVVPAPGYEINPRSYKKSVWVKYNLNYVDYEFQFLDMKLHQNELYSTAFNSSAVVCRDNCIYYIPARTADNNKLSILKLNQKTMEVTKEIDLPFIATRNVSLCMLEQSGYDFLILGGSEENYTRLENEDVYTRSNNNIYRYHVKEKKFEIVGNIANLVPDHIYSITALLRKDGKVVLFNTVPNGPRIGDQSTYVFDPFTNDFYKEDNDLNDLHPYRNNIACHNGDFYRIASKEYNPMPVWDYVSNTIDVNMLQTPPSFELPIRNLVIEEGVDYTLEDPYRYATITIKPGGRLHYLAYDDYYKVIEGDTIVICGTANVDLTILRNSTVTNFYLINEREMEMLDEEIINPPTDRTYEVLDTNNVVVVTKGPTVPIPDNLTEAERLEYLYKPKDYKPKEDDDDIFGEWTIDKE